MTKFPFVLSPTRISTDSARFGLLACQVKTRLALVQQIGQYTGCEVCIQNRSFYGYTSHGIRKAVQLF